MDTDFHIALAETGGNRLTRDLTAAIREVIQVPIQVAENRIADWTRLRQALIHEHNGIYEAISAGQPNLAMERAETHIRNAYARLQPIPAQTD